MIPRSTAPRSLEAVIHSKVCRKAVAPALPFPFVHWWHIGMAHLLRTHTALTFQTPPRRCPSRLTPHTHMVEWLGAQRLLPPPVRYSVFSFSYRSLNNRLFCLLAQIDHASRAAPVCCAFRLTTPLANSTSAGLSAALDSHLV